MPGLPGKATAIAIDQPSVTSETATPAWSERPCRRSCPADSATAPTCPGPAGRSATAIAPTVMASNYLQIALSVGIVAIVLIGAYYAFTRIRASS